MVTGPVSIPFTGRGDLAHAAVAMQIALALRDEIADLERAGIRVIQVDEPALREGLPLRRAERADYLRWATDAFRLSTGGARDETQIHTHMCYADFAEIVDAAARMDIDVISLEAARSGMALLRSIDAESYDRAVGPGVYDVHRPACPSVGEIVHHIAPALETFGPEQLWVNPDCGLKTRSWNEVQAALANMVDAAPVVRPGLVGGVESGNSENARHATRTGTAA